MTTGDDGRRDQRFEAAFRRYYARVYRWLRSCRVADDEAHDLAQDSFKRFYERLPTIRSENEWPFLQSIVRSVFLNWLRAGRTIKRSMPLVDIDSPDFKEDLAAEPEPDYVDQLQTAARRKRLYEAIAELSDGQQQAMLLWLDGKPYEEIAEKLGVSLDAIRSRLRDARRFLRSRLGADELPEEDQ